MCKTLCILHALLHSLSLAAFLGERYNFYFHLTEEIQLVKGQIGSQSQ